MTSTYSLSGRAVALAFLMVVGSIGGVPLAAAGAGPPETSHTLMGGAGNPTVFQTGGISGATTADSNLTSGQHYWTGQSLAFQGTASEENGTYNLYNLSAGGEFMTQIRLDENASAILQTRGLSGDYYLTDADGDPVIFNASGQKTGTGTSREASFEVTRQTLTVDPEMHDVATEPPGSLTGIPLTFDSNRATFDLVVTWETPEELSATEAVSIFDESFTATAVDVDDEEPGADAVLLRDVKRVQEYTVNMTGLPLGDYDFTFVPRDGSAAAEIDIDIIDPDELQAEPDPREVSVARGDVAEFEIEFDDAQNATVVIGDRDLNYLANLSVTDVDVDNEVTLEVNTYTAGRQNGSIALEPIDSGSDRLVVDSGAENATGTSGPLSDLLAPAVYPISVSANPLATYRSTLDDPQAFGTLSITERRTNGIQVYRAPIENWDELGEADDVEDGIDRGWMTPTESVVTFEDHSELFVAQIEATGIFGAYENETGTGLERLRALEGVYNVSIEQTAESSGLNQDPIELDLGASDETGVRVFPNQETRSLYVAVRPDSDGAVWVQDGNEVAFDSDASYTVEFRVPEDSPLSTDDDADQVVTDELSIVEPAISWDGGDDIGVLPRSDQMLRAETNLAPETELTVRVRSTDSSNFTFQTRDVTVLDNGSITPTFDFGALPSGTEFTITVLKGSEEISEDRGIVLSEPSTSTPSTTNQTTTPTSTTIPTSTSTTTTTTTTTDTPTTTPTTTTLTSTTLEPTTTTTTTTTPGFGVGLALVALLGAALLALRQKD